ncbi:MAG: Asp-tRNA(Asn)/Glu-tRNA(Gln) amidotransferase subunit GatA [Patescibacteria group bacterium]
MTIAEIQKSFKNKELSCVELVKSCLKKIKKEDGEIHAFLEVFEDEALAEAKKVDEKISQKKKLGVLEGVPVAIKDNLMYRGHRVSAGSRILENYVAPYSATAVEKLKSAGAIILGRTNMDEFAMGSSTENSAYGPTKNPRDTKRVPGGSSGGSAAAVAAGFVPVALGSDTGGSIRQPASFCGVAGLKPTYGAVSRYGLIAMSSSLDQIGPIANTAEDAQIVFDVIKGVDSKDATSVKEQRTKNKEQVKNLKVGIPKEYFIKGTDSVVKERVEEAIEKFKKMGAKIQEVSLPHTEYALAAYYLIMPAEVSSNLARFDGIRYGLSLNKDAKNLKEVYTKTRARGFGAEPKRRIILGTYALSAGYFDAYYKKARQAQEIIQQDFLNVFKKVDCLFTPTAPSQAFKLGEKTSDPLQMYLEDIFTVSVNLAGLPAISIPVQQKGELPVGLQIIGRPFEENLILDVAKHLSS